MLNGLRNTCNSLLMLASAIVSGTIGSLYYIIKTGFNCVTPAKVNVILNSTDVKLALEQVLKGQDNVSFPMQLTLANQPFITCEPTILAGAEVVGTFAACTVGLNFLYRRRQSQLTANLSVNNDPLEYRRLGGHSSWSCSPV